MSTAPAERTPLVTPDRRRVRHQARDAAAVMAFSLGTSLLLATVFLLLAGLGR